MVKMSAGEASMRKVRERPRQAPSRLNERAEKAVAAGDVESLRRWLGFGANPNHSSLQGPLIRCAASMGDAQIVAALLGAGADPGAKWPEMERAGGPLFCAVNSGSVECVELLLAAGADPDGGRHVDSSLGLAPVQVAAVHGKGQMLAILGEAGASMNLADDRDYSPLLYAIASVRAHQSPECVKTCLKYGADPNARGRNGETPAMNALRLDSRESMEALCEFGFDPDVVDDGGRTVADHLGALGWTETGKALRSWLLAKDEEKEISVASRGVGSNVAAGSPKSRL